MEIVLEVQVLSWKLSSRKFFWGGYTKIPEHHGVSDGFPNWNKTQYCCCYSWALQVCIETWQEYSCCCLKGFEHAFNFQKISIWSSQEKSFGNVSLYDCCDIMIVLQVQVMLSKLGSRKFLWGGYSKISEHHDWNKTQYCCCHLWALQVCIETWQEYCCCCYTAVVIREPSKYVSKPEKSIVVAVKEFEDTINLPKIIMWRFLCMVIGGDSRKDIRATWNV